MSPQRKLILRKKILPDLSQMLSQRAILASHAVGEILVKHSFLMPSSLMFYYCWKKKEKIHSLLLSIVEACLITVSKTHFPVCRCQPSEECFVTVIKISLSTQFAAVKQVLQGQTFTTLQTEGGQETIIIVQAADPNEVTHAIVEGEEGVQFTMQPAEDEPSTSATIFTAQMQT